MTTESPPDRPTSARRTQRQAYTSWIEQTCKNDPGARSALRSGLRRGIDEVPRMHRLVAPWLPRDGAVPDSEQRAYYAVAAMIAAQPRSRYSEADDEETQAAPGPDSSSDKVLPDQRAVAEAPRVGRYGVSLGTAFALAVAQGPGREREMRESSAESRLNLLTRQSVTGLYRHLPASTRYLRELDVPVDWAQLLDDLIAWPVHSGRISRRWLQDYYRLRAKADHAKAARADEQEAEEPGPRP